jgi:predicted membrane protein
VWPRWLTDPLTGKTSLGRAFWLYGLGGSFVYSVIGLLFPETPAGLTVYVLLGLAIGILQSVILWRCAPNSRSAFVGRFVRTAVIVGLILVPVMLYLLFTNSDMLLPPNNRWRGP